MATQCQTQSRTRSHEEAWQNSLLEHGDTEGTLSNHVLQVFNTYTVCFGLDELEESPRKRRCSESGGDRDSDGAVIHWCSVHPVEYKLQQQPRIKSGLNKGNSQPAKRVEIGYGAFQIKIMQRLAYSHFLLSLANKLNTSVKYLNRERMEFQLGSG